MDTKIHIKTSVWILLSAMVLATACKEENNIVPDSTFQIGVLAPLTGSASSVGESVSAALNLAVNDVNDYLQSTGNELEIELVIKDTGTDPATSLQKLKELEDAGIKYLIGPYASTNVEAVLSYADDNGLFLLSPASVATTLAISGDNLYRLIPSDRSQADAITALFKHDSIEAVIPVVRNDVFGNSLLSDVGNTLSTQGISMTDPILYNPSNVNSTDIANQVSTSIDLLNSQTQHAHIGVYLLSFGEGTGIMSAASTVQQNALVRWYGSSANANSSGLLLDIQAREFAYEQKLRCPSFAPDPSVMDLWGPVNDHLTTMLGRTPEVFALTSYDAVWVMALSYVLAQNPDDPDQFKSSFEQLTAYYNGITGRTTLDANGDRKYASYNFWGVEPSGSDYSWKPYGYYRNADGQLVIY